MASQIIGRTDCPECGFKSAHVKRSDKCAYRYCPECGSQYMATGAEREAALLAKTRLNALPVAGPSVPPAPKPVVIPADPATPPTPTPPAAPVAKRRVGLFGQREA